MMNHINETNIIQNDLQLITELTEEDETKILSAKNIMIKEEMNIDEVLYDTTIFPHINMGEFKQDPLELTPIEPAIPAPKFICKMCAAIFTQYQDLNMHLTKHCCLTELNVNADTRDSDHDYCFEEMTNVSNKIFCRICNAYFPQMINLKHHLIEMHRPCTFEENNVHCSWSNSNAREIINCNICDIEVERCLLQTHLSVVHRPLTLHYASDAFCEKCYRWYTEESYDLHECVQRINSMELLICVICQKLFEYNDLKGHLFNVHRPLTISDFDASKVFCDFCTKCFDEDEFEMHLPCHSVDFKCVFCWMVMPTKEHFLQHDLTWKRWGCYQCNLCSCCTQDMELSTLNNHMKNHGLNGVFRCVKCKFDFNCVKRLEDHMEDVHVDCRCFLSSCVCSTFNYEIYYQFVKKRNLYVNFKNLENDIVQIRERRYNAVESTIDLECWTTTNHQKVLSNVSSNCYNYFESDCNDSKYLLNNIKIEETELKTEEIMLKTEEEVHEEEQKQQQIDVFVKGEQSKQQNIPTENFLDVILIKSTQGYGFTLVGENPCRLANVIPNSPANLAGLKNGNSIIQINDTNVFFMPHDSIVDLIRKSGEKLRMKIFQVAFYAPREALVFLQLPKIEYYKCNICEEQFITQVYLNDHLIRKHRPFILKEKFYCWRCEKEFVEYLKFLYHDPCNTKKLQRCTICHLRKPSLKHYKLHNLLFRNDEYLCTICSPLDRPSLTLDAMNEHRQKVHNKSGVYECLKCQIDFATYHEIEEHIMKHLKNKEILDHKKYNLNMKTQLFCCDVCDKMCLSEKRLANHKRVHKFGCELCKEKFATVAEVKEHMTTHTEKTFVCHICGKRYLLKRHLNLHLRNHDDSNKTFSCDECGQKFAHYTSMACHVASHTNENLFQCVVCKKKFDKQAKLYKHMDVHNNDGTNPNKCEYCDRLFTHKCKLILHLRVHQPKNRINNFSVKEALDKTNTKKKQNIYSSSSSSSASSSSSGEEKQDEQPIENKRRSKRKRIQRNVYIETQSDSEVDEEK